MAIHWCSLRFLVVVATLVSLMVIGSCATAGPAVEKEKVVKIGLTVILQVPLLPVGLRHLRGILML